MQSAYLQSIRSCGQSLAETVNHVLEFQKLSGAAVDVIATSPVNLLQLVEEAAECGWMGAKAIHEAVVDLGGDTLPPTQEDARASMKVELIIDVEHLDEGWDLRCEKNGLRRILLNVLSNAIKFTEVCYLSPPCYTSLTPFTKRGYIHVSIRRTDDGLCSLAIVDSGKVFSSISDCPQYLTDYLGHERRVYTGKRVVIGMVAFPSKYS
jgi:signal transduction histidine kinase